jgi:hypothetical protein
MNRRKFLLIAITSAIAATTLKAFATAKVYVTEGKLGYKLNGNPGRQCLNCKHFEAASEDGECKLSVMRNVMKSKQVFVKPTATCNMWVQK